MKAQFLQQIVAQKRAEEQGKSFEPNQAVKSRIPTPLKLGKSHPFGIIAEVKQASPSAGLIRGDFQPATIAKMYAEAGAVAISVLTEPNFFKGDITHLQAVKDAVDLPVLRKDFIVSMRQIYESYQNGADVVLLIVACLSDGELADLHDFAASLGMQTLVEVHSEGDLERALRLNPNLIGINNRNLDTLEVKLETSLQLIEKIPANCVAIAESGISEPQYVAKLKASGFAGALVGESLLRQSDVGTALKALLG